MSYSNIQRKGLIMSDDTSVPDSRITASVERLRHELDRWLEFAVEQGERAIGAIRPRGTGHWTPDVDVLESADAVLVVVDLPGVDPGSVDVSLAGNMLTISGEKSPVQLAELQTTHHCERHCGKFSRSIPMPAPVEAEDVSAQSRDGVLQVRLAKSERAKARRIQVGGSSGGDQPGHESHG